MDPDSDNPLPSYDPTTIESIPVPVSAGRDWALPEAPGESTMVVHGATAEFRPGGRSQAEADQSGARAGRGEPPLLPVALKPMTLSDILDGSWGIIKARPRTVLGLTAIIVMPVQLIAAFLQRGAAQSADILTAFANTGSSAGRTSTSQQFNYLVLAYIGQALGVLSYYFLGAALGRLVSAWYSGGDLTIGQTLAATFKKAHIIVAAYAILIIPTVLSAGMCYIGAFFIIPLFLLTAPIITIENLGPVAAAQRSWKLVSRRLFPCILIWFASFLVEALVNQAIELGPDLLALFELKAVVPVVVPMAAAAARFVTAPFVVGVAVLLYLDLRVRTEGLDLELEANDVFAHAV